MTSPRGSSSSAPRTRAARQVLAGFILFCLAAAAGRAQGTARASTWEKEISAFEAADRVNAPPKGAALFIGSSSIRLWKTLAHDFPEHQVINRGFGGSHIEDSIHFANRIVWPYEPRLVVLYAGGNDLNSGKPPVQVFSDFKEFVHKVRERLPETTIAYISIAGNPARWAQVEKVRAVNSMIEQYAKEQPGLKFINVFPHMLDANGLPREEIFTEDKLHMNAAGYRIWADLVRPFLDE